MSNKLSTLAWKGRTTGNDIAHYYLIPHKCNGEQVFTLETHILTENPQDYCEWYIVRKFGNKFLIAIQQTMKEYTWLAVEGTIRLFHKNGIPNNDPEEE